MLQRIQSVWLLLAAAFDAVTFRFPFYSGDWIKDHFLAVIDLNAQTTIWITILSVLTGGLAFVTIFMYHNRKMQLRLVYLGIFLSALLLTVYFLEIKNFIGGNITIWVIFYFAILISFIMAAKGILRDKRLIKSLDRLR